MKLFYLNWLSLYNKIIYVICISNINKKMSNFFSISFTYFLLSFLIHSRNERIKET